MERPPYVVYAEWLLKGKRGNWELAQKINQGLKGAKMDEVIQNFAIFMPLEKLEALKRTLDRYPRGVRGGLYNIVREALKRKKTIVNKVSNDLKACLNDFKLRGSMGIFINMQTFQEMDLLLKYAPKLRNEICKILKVDRDLATRFFIEFKRYKFDKRFPYLFELLQKII